MNLDPKLIINRFHKIFFLFFASVGCAQSFLVIPVVDASSRDMP